MTDALPPLKSLSGHDGYCHVCWNDVYRFWVAKESPDYDRCPMGDFTAQTCPDATGRARNVAMIAQLKADGLWPSKVSAAQNDPPGKARAKRSRPNTKAEPEQKDQS